MKPRRGDELVRAARRRAALFRPELRDEPATTKPAVGVTSPATKVPDPETRKLIDEALKSRK